VGEIRSWARKTGRPRERKAGGWKEQEFICNRKGQIQMQKREDTARVRESERERTRACARERERAKEILRKRGKRRETVRDIVREKESMCMYVQKKEKERKKERAYLADEKSAIAQGLGPSDAHKKSTMRECELCHRLQVAHPFMCCNSMTCMSNTRPCLLKSEKHIKDMRSAPHCQNNIQLACVVGHT